MKIMIVLGTRPEVIKLAPIIYELKNTKIDTIICSTGQHQQMLNQSFDVFNLKPDIDLGLMQNAQTLNHLSSKIITSIDNVISENQPDWILVQGDTTTAFCSSLAAFHRRIRIGHVEAGLRTGNIYSPFPEEANRSLLARLVTKNFCPTQKAKESLISENIKPSSIYVTGNTVVDAINIIKACPKFYQKNIMKQQINYSKKMVLITCHRREIFGETIVGICKMIARLCHFYTNYHFIFPVHLNPEVQMPVYKHLSNIDNISLINPVDYPTSLYLLSHCKLVLTDSGGIQEEAPSFNAPVVIMRDHTERMEGVEKGFSFLAGTDPYEIEKIVHTILDNSSISENLCKMPNPYGDGLASSRIVSSLLNQPFKQFNG